MTYSMQFGAIAQHSQELMQGLFLTVQLAAGSIGFGTAIGISMASLRSIYGGAVGTIVRAYVEIIRNTPFLVQLFIIYFGFPAIGLKIDATTTALIGMVINLGAYSTEIIRAGIESIHKSQIEAGKSLGFTRYQIYRHVIIGPAVANVYPALCSQFILMTLASSVCSAISTEELTAVTAQIESTTYRSFEVYIVATLIYLMLSFALRGAFAVAGRWMFGRRVPVLLVAPVQGA
jgi:polar amino acid transport system permease protein